MAMTSQTGSPSNNSSSMTKTPNRLQDFVKRHRDKILLILSIVLIALAVFLVFLLITQAYTDVFTCGYLIDQKLGGNAIPFCEGIKFQIRRYDIDLPDIIFTIQPFGIGPFPADPITILPGLNPINGPLEDVRRFVVWNIVIAFAVVSLVLAFIASKIIGFVRLLLTPEGRTLILTNFSLWLLFFAIFSCLFYIAVVAR